MQFEPDYTLTLTITRAEEELKDFKFRGPGLYLTKTDTMLVVTKGVNPWIEQTGADYSFHIWNSPYEDILLSQFSEVPLRQDDR